MNGGCWLLMPDGRRIAAVHDGQGGYKDAATGKPITSAQVVSETDTKKDRPK